MELRILADVANESTSVFVTKSGQRLADGSWHQLNLAFNQQDMSLAIDHRRPAFIELTKINAPALLFDDDSFITIGVGSSQLQNGISLRLSFVTVIL